MNFDCHAITQKGKACKLKANGSLQVTTTGGRKVWAQFCERHYGVFFGDENQPNVQADADCWWICSKCDVQVAVRLNKCPMCNFVRTA